jgi:PPM family protein phosphatase
MKPTPMEIASRTDKGLVRSINEDSIVVVPDHGLAVLADGMGGLNAGEVASHLAVESVAKDLLRRMQRGEEPMNGAVLGEAVRAANQAILRAMEEDPSCAGMATTIAVLLLRGNQVHFAHLGDSRIYRVTPERIECVTTDHSMIQELVDQGLFFSLEEARNAGVPNNVLTRGLGVEEEVQVDIGEARVVPADVYLLCSDGLTNMVSDEEIRQTLQEAGGDLNRAADRLVQMALQAGGLDNVSLILARPRS